MRRFVARTLGAVLPLVPVFLLLSIFAFGQAQSSGKPNRSAKSAASDTTLKADPGPAIKVETPFPRTRRTPSSQQDGSSAPLKPAGDTDFQVMSHPHEYQLVRGNSFAGDVRKLAQMPPKKIDRPEFEGPQVTPAPYPGTSSSPQQTSAATEPSTPVVAIPAPTPAKSFDGLDLANWGDGYPPDTNGDVGPNYYIQTINTSVGIYNKSDGSRLAAFTFNTLMSQGAFGNLCDTDNYGDPVVVYDTFEDRWIITDFAFKMAGGILNPPGMFQCFAVSKSGDPVSGGWSFYSVQLTDFLGDYPKFGVWPDGIYWSANLFGFPAGGSFQNCRVWALNKTQMYAGAKTVQILSFDAPAAEFTLLPSNARLQTGTPPAGSPNYFATVYNYTNKVSVYKLHADWNNTSSSTFSGPFLSATATTWSQLFSQQVASPANPLDNLSPRLMVQNQYTNISGAESLWDSHTVGATLTQAAIRYYQVDVTGGNVAASATQAFTYSPDTTVHRFMPSAAVDRAGDMAIGYSVSSATLNPGIRYAGRLAADPANSITQTETSLIEGTGTQSGNCGSTCTRWGDYSAMTLDPDGCTFWYTNMYYQVTGLNFNTRVGTFSFPSCTPVSTGSITGTVTAAGTGSPISGVTVSLGSRTTTTAADGTYSFSGIASGTYPSIAASFPGYSSTTALNVVVTDGVATTENFSLVATTAVAVGAATGTFGGMANLSAILTSNSAGVSGKTLSFTLNGNSVGSGATDGSGVATVSNVSLAGINVGSYPGAVAASFAGDSGFGANSSSGTLTVTKSDQTISFGALAAKTFGDPDFSVSATASSGLAVSFAAAGNCSISGLTVHIISPGSCTITASQAGDTNYNVATDVAQSFTIKTGQTITFGALANKTFGDPDFSVSGTASSGLVVTFSASGNCTVSGSAVHLTAPGVCTITASQAGNASYNAAADVPQSFSIAKISQTITFGALAGKLFGNPDFTVSATTSSGLAVSFSGAGNCSVSGATVHITGAGSCSVTASQPGDATYNEAATVQQSFTISNPDFTLASTPASVTVTAGQSETEHITFTPNPGISNPLAFACSGLPASSNCTFSPSTVLAGSTQVDVVLTIATTAAMAGLLPRRTFYAAWQPLGLGLVGIVVIGRRGSRKLATGLATLVFIVVLLVGCGGCPTPNPGSAGTPPGTYTITVTGASGSVTRSAIFSLTVN